MGLTMSPSEPVGHLGIVAGTYDTLELERLSIGSITKTRQHNLTHNQTVKLMVPNGLLVCGTSTRFIP
jgi:Domain of unknown function (DUF4277)